MSKIAWLANKVSQRHVAHATDRHLTSLANAPIRASRRTASELLRTLANETGPTVRLGETSWGEPVALPLTEFVRACGIATGGMGSGKTMAACLILEALISHLPELRTMSFGVLDAKGELFERATYLLGAR